MKEASKKNHLREEIFSIVDNKPELLETLSVEQLEEVNSMYDKIIEENNKKINKLKRKLA